MRRAELTKRLLILAAVFSVGLACAARKSGFDPAKQYVDSHVGFSVTPPKGWVGRLATDLPDVDYVAVKSVPTDNWIPGVSFRPNVTLGTELVPRDLTVEEYQDAAIGALEREGWFVRKTQGVSWGGRPAIEVEADRAQDNVALLQRYVLIRSRALVLACTCRPRQMASVRAECEQMFDSLRIRLDP